jgi:hypothetical protein
MFRQNEMSAALNRYWCLACVYSFDGMRIHELE